MPPKMKMAKSHRCSSKTCKGACTNPRVILKPFLADPSGQSHYRFSSLPATASLFNKPDFSDVKLKVGEDYYFAHKLVLCASSDVFACMFDEGWKQFQAGVLVLQEEEDCIKVFDRFMYYLYAGNITISESYVIPLFALADKYNVKPLYDECVKVIVNGLKVYVVLKKSLPKNEMIAMPGPSSMCDLSAVASGGQMSSSGDSSELSESDDSTGSGDENEPCSSVVVKESLPNASPTRLARRTAAPLPGPMLRHLMVASETFPLLTVMKMLTFCHNERIHKAALYNLEARLGNQICHKSYTVWNDLQCNLLVKMLSDKYFSYNEFCLFEAACAWLHFCAKRQVEATLAKVLSKIRYPLLTAKELYEVEKNEMVKMCPVATEMVQEAIRYKLFKECCKPEDRDRWSGPQFEERKVKD